MRRQVPCPQHPRTGGQCKCASGVMWVCRFLGLLNSKDHGEIMAMMQPTPWCFWVCLKTGKNPQFFGNPKKISETWFSESNFGVPGFISKRHLKPPIGILAQQRFSTISFQSLLVADLYWKVARGLSVAKQGFWPKDGGSSRDHVAVVKPRKRRCRDAPFLLSAYVVVWRAISHPQKMISLGFYSLPQP